MTKPDPAHWQRVRFTFEVLLGRGEEVRRLYLAEIAHEDPTLAADVREMLRADATRGTFLDRDPSLPSDG